MEGAAVFLNQEIQLDLNGPTIPVLRADQLKDYVRARAKEARLTNGAVRALCEYLAAQAKFDPSADS